MNFSKLTPAPLVVREGNYDEIWKDGSVQTRTDYSVARLLPDLPVPGAFVAVADGIVGKDDAEFFALARNAFDVMMRRGWSPRREWAKGRWFVPQIVGAAKFDTILAFEKAGGILYYDNPFTALVESDKWLTEHEKNSGAAG